MITVLPYIWLKMLSVLLIQTCGPGAIFNPGHFGL